MLAISSAQRRELRARAHNLHPVVSIADNGLSASVVKEIELSLKAHELIKIRVYGDDREKRVAIYEALCKQLGCAPVQHIGKLLIVFRANPAPEIAEPSAPTTRRAARGGLAKKSSSKKLGARTAGILSRTLVKAKRAAASSSSRGAGRDSRANAAVPRTTTGTLGASRRTNGTTIKSATPRGTARPVLTSASRRSGKR